MLNNHLWPDPWPARVPPSIRPGLAQYLDALAGRAPGLLLAFYLTGSIGLDAFDAQQSDVDFVAVLNRRATAADLELLRAVHRDVARAYPGCKLEGGYMQAADLGRFPPEVAPYPGYHEGRLEPAGYHELSPVTWWLLKRHVVVVFGAHPAALPFSAGWDAVRRYMLANLNTYWQPFARPSRRLPWLLTGDGVQWAVLGICRLWYAFAEGDIPSKVQAGQYALAQAPERWHSILSEALAVRRGEPSCYRSRLARAQETSRFVGYTIQECNARYGP